MNHLRSHCANRILGLFADPLGTPAPWVVCIYPEEDASSDSGRWPRQPVLQSTSSSRRSGHLPADPPTYRSLVLRWWQGDEIPLPGRTLRVLGVRDDDADQSPALVVEDLPGSATSAAG